MLAQGGAATVRASALETLVRADTGAATILASASHAVVLADASTPALQTFAFLAVVLTDADAPAALAAGSLAVVWALAASLPLSDILFVLMRRLQAVGRVGSGLLRVMG